MRPLGVVGPPEAEPAAAVERLVAHFAERGRVATVTDVDASPAVDGDSTLDRHRRAGAAAAYGLAADGVWRASGDDRTLQDLLADLAPDHDYVVVEGHPEADVPAVALGDADPAGETIASAPDAASFDPASVETALEGTDHFETLESLVAHAKTSRDEQFAGAVATFTGRVRAKDAPGDVATEHLEFERYDEVAADRMAAIREDLRAREGVYEVLLHHRTGVVPAGEDVVHVVVLAGHREEAFAAVSDGIDRLKEEVPLFKKEVTVEGAHWKHEEELDEV